MPTYFYQGHERLSFLFHSPNRCAVALAIIVVLLSGILAAAATSHQAYTTWGKSSVIVLALAIISLATATSYTYSRGGYLALIGGLLVLYSLVPKGRWIPAATLAVSIFLIIGIPSGASRILSLAKSDPDASIGNRLVLWYRTLGMLADWWPHAVGLKSFRSVFVAWYQPNEMHQYYLTPVNDYFTAAISIGIGWFFAAMMACAMFLQIAARIARLAKSTLLAAAVSSLCVYLIGGLWSTMMFEPNLRIISAIPAFIAIFLVIRHRSVVTPSVIWRAFKYSATGISIVIIGAAVVGLSAVKSVPYHPIVDNESEAPYHCETLPRNGAYKGWIIIAYEYWAIARQVRETVRPLVDDGYAVACFCPSDFGEIGARQLSRYIRVLPNVAVTNVCFIGFGRSGCLFLRPGVVDGSPAQSLVLVGTPAWSPMREYSAMDNIANIKKRLLIAHAAGDFKVDPNDARVLFRTCEKLAIPAQLALLNSADHAIADNPGELVAAILKFQTTQ